MPATGIPARLPVALPYTSLLERMFGSIRRGMPMMLRISSSQSSVRRFMSIVREALVTSVMCTPPSGPPVSHHVTKVSTLPNMALPDSAAWRAPSTLSRIQRTFGPEK